MAASGRRIKNISLASNFVFTFFIRHNIIEAPIRDDCCLISPNAEVVAGTVLRPPVLRLKALEITSVEVRLRPGVAHFEDPYCTQIFKQRNVHSAQHPALGSVAGGHRTYETPDGRLENSG